MEPDRLIKRYRRRRSAEQLVERTSNVTHGSRSRRAVPHIIYPEILVIVDYDGYRLHGGDNVQVIERKPARLDDDIDKETRSRAYESSTVTRRRGGVGFGSESKAEHLFEDNIITKNDSSDLMIANGRSTVR